MNRAEVSVQKIRTDNFKSDRQVTTRSASTADYRSTGFDRGHLSPAADNSASVAINDESFLMSNMSPQLPLFNRDVWAELEHWVRIQAEVYDTIYVATGPIFVNNLGKIGNNEVTIPGYFYKVLLRFDGNSAKTIAFLLPHTISSNADFRDHVVSVNTIETLTGIDFFPSISNRTESSVATSNWYMKLVLSEED